MTKIKEIYKCEICGNIVEILNPGEGEIVCCGQPMSLQLSKIEETGQEKHLPVIEDLSEGLRVKIGAVEHPMEESHYIQWIEVNTINGESKKYFLTPGQKPEITIKEKNKIESVRAYCNIHGLWLLKIRTD